MTPPTGAGWPKRGKARTRRLSRTAGQSAAPRKIARPALEIEPETMNGIEARFASLLKVRFAAGEIVWWRYEGLRFRLAAGAYYTPDFAVLTSEGTLTIYETKGHWREAAKVRIKTAAAAYPWVRFVAVYDEAGRFVEEEIKK